MPALTPSARRAYGGWFAITSRGGLHFIKLGRLRIQWSVARRAKRVATPPCNVRHPLFSDIPLKPYLGEPLNVGQRLRLPSIDAHPFP